MLRLLLLILAVLLGSFTGVISSIPRGKQRLAKKTKKALKASGKKKK